MLIVIFIFSGIYKWSEQASGELKIGLDLIMCSMCHVQPSLFTQLLLNMSVLTMLDPNITSLTDDR